jgi:anti-anti-sigma factor
MATVPPTMTPTSSPSDVIAETGVEDVVVPVGELDIAASGALEQEVAGLVRDGSEHVVIDLRRLTFIDSSGMQRLLSLRNDAKRNGHRLTLVPAGPRVQRLFVLTRTQGLFDWRRPDGARRAL